jgi:hypothetical protein
LTSWTGLTTIFLLYVGLCASLRFRHEKAMLRRFKYADRASLANMSNDDASEILKSLMVYEFPKLYMASLQFAIFKVSGRDAVASRATRTDCYGARHMLSKPCLG